MKIILAILLFIILFNIVGCSNKFSKYKIQIEVTKKLINRIIENDTTSIKKMIGVDPHEIGLNDEKIMSSIEAINKSIGQENNSKLTEYKFREYPKTSPHLVDVIVTIKKFNADNKYIVVSFVKFLEDGKIYYFELINAIPKNLEDLPPPK